MHGETFFYDDQIKGHRLLISDQIVNYKGRTLQAANIRQVSAVAFTMSINGIPTNATFRVSFSDGETEIAINCALGVGTFGRKNYEQVRAAALKAAGYRLIQEALQDLQWS